MAGIIGKTKKTLRQGKTWFRRTMKKIMKDRLYDYTTPENRADTAAFLLAFADTQRGTQLGKWEMYENYYNFHHEATDEMKEYCEENDLPFTPAVVPDAFIHCESQILASIPEHEFIGRDDDMDSEKARQRQYVVQYVIDNNDMETKNADNERRINIKGMAWWKIGYDDRKMIGPYYGSIFIKDIDAVNCVSDPVALSLDDCEYFDYVYPMHRMRAQREFARQLAEKNLKIDELGGISNPLEELNPETTDTNSDIVQVQEHWFRQPADGKMEFTYEKDGKTIKDTVEWEAGDIACTIIISDTEIQYIPKYWMKTSKQNKMYPFVAAMKIPVLNSFYGMSEIAPLKELIDAADREFGTVLLNDAFMGNDIIVIEDDALSDDTEAVPNAPGGTAHVKAGRANGIRRLGGLSNSNIGLQNTVERIREMIKQTAGNFDVNMGNAPPSNVSTLGGLIELRDQGNSRQNKKMPKWIAAWKRLYRLVDYTALEFWDDDRVIWLGAQDQGTSVPQPLAPSEDYTNMDKSKGPVRFTFNADKMKAKRTTKDGQTEEYYPEVDLKITVGDGVSNSRGMTAQVLEKLAGMNIDQRNYWLVQELVDLLGVPNRKSIKARLEELYGQPAAEQSPGGGMLPDDMQALMDNPEMLADLLKQNPEMIKALLPDIPPEEIEALRANPDMIDEMLPELLEALKALTQGQQASAAEIGAPGEGLRESDMQQLAQNPQMLAEMLKAKPELLAAILPGIPPEEIEAIRANPALLEKMLPELLQVLQARMNGG
jgi:hypothetical protein